MGYLKEGERGAKREGRGDRESLTEDKKQERVRERSRMTEAQFDLLK